MKNSHTELIMRTTTEINNSKDYKFGDAPEPDFNSPAGAVIRQKSAPAGLPQNVSESGSDASKGKKWLVDGDGPTAEEKRVQSLNVTSGSLRPRRKSFRQPQTTWMSLTRFCTVKPSSRAIPFTISHQRPRADAAFISVSSEHTMYVRIATRGQSITRPAVYCAIFHSLSIAPPCAIRYTPDKKTKLTWTVPGIMSDRWWIYHSPLDHS